MLRCALEVDMLIEHGARVFGVTARDVRAIVHIATSGPMSATRLAERLLVTRGAMTSILRRLERGGWLDVVPDPVDRRCLVVTASERSRRLLDAWRSGFHGLHEQATRHAPSETLALELEAASTVLATQRGEIGRMGPAELRALAGS